MPWIEEEGRRLHVTHAEAESLLAARLVTSCLDCRAYHHDEYERWEDVEAFLRTAQQFVAFVRAAERRS